MSVEPGNRGIVQRFGGESGYFVKGRIPQVGDPCILYPVDGSDLPVCIPFANIDIGNFVMLVPDFNFDFLTQVPLALIGTNVPISVTGYWQRKVAYVGEAVSLGAVQFNWDGDGSVYLSGSSSGLSATRVDDGVIVSTSAGNLVFTGNIIDGWSHNTPNITSICRPGMNTIDVIIYDIYGTNIGSHEIWVIKV